MAQKFIGLRGIDPALYDEVIRIVKAKNQGKRRAKYSFVAREINELFRLYIKSEGEVVAHTRTDPKEKIISELEEAVEKRGLPAVDAVLDKHHIIDERARNNYVGYADRYMTRITAADFGQARNRVKNKDVPGYR